MLNCQSIRVGFPTGILAAALLSALLGLSLLATAPAWATTFEQVGCFAGTGEEPCAPIDLEKEEFGEEVQLGYAGGMAVNYTGAGGVPKGTVYAAAYDGTRTWVSMFEPKAGGLRFVEAWVAASNPGPYERCGPLLGEPGGVVEHPCSPLPGGSAWNIDVDIDQATGNVYVLRAGSPGQERVVLFNADASEEITRFGEVAPQNESVAESPQRIHGSDAPEGIAVTGGGRVYVFDLFNGGEISSQNRRLMVFEPQTPGEYDDYVYAGEVLTGSGISGSGFGSTLPAAPVTDAAGNIYVFGAGYGEEFIEKYAPQTPAPYPAPPVAPLCSFEFEKSGLTALTVNPVTEEPFFFSYKKPKAIHRLSAECEGGEFVETGTIAVAPERDDLSALAIDPIREFSPGRPAGVLYGGAPSGQPSGGVGKGEPGQSPLGYIFAPPVEAPPVVTGEAATRVKTTSAVLRASVDPKAFLTQYVFQYLSEDEYQGAGETFTEAAQVPIGGDSLEGTGPRAVAATVSGLEPDTAYRFRVVATSNCKPDEPEFVCETDGAGFAFHTFPLETAALPDGRAWELVSPPQKNGGQVLPADPGISSCSAVGCKPGATYQHFPMQSAPDGNAVAFEGTPFSSEVGANTENQYVSRRTPSGWVTANPTPRRLFSGSGNGYRSLSTNLEEAVIGQVSPPLSPEAPAEFANLYAQDLADPLPLEPFLNTAPGNRSPSAFAMLFAGAAVDGSRAFFAANDALTEETGFAPAAGDGGAGKFNLYEWHDGDLALVNVLPGNAEAPAGAAFGGGQTSAGNAISADGSTAFWSDEAGQVYARIDGSETVEIDDPGKYLSASTDGSLVLLRDGCLFSLQTRECTDLTQGKGGFQGIVGQSDDLSHVYFVDTAVLSEEENSEGDKAQDGAFNLYAWVNGEISFVARLGAEDNVASTGSVASRDWATSPAARTAEASPSGAYVAFLSRTPLTGYGNTGPCDSDHDGGYVDGPCLEVFVYDSATAKLRCASCNPSGAPPLGISTLRLIVGTPPYLPQPRYLTDSGRLFFDSQDSLVPADTNEGVEDVYQWEPEGVGSCQRENGCVQLLSGGRDGVDANFLAADPFGDNVFFTTRDRLVASDTDELIDVYDARVGGGFAQESVLPPQPCLGEGCLGSPQASTEPPPASATFDGTGNVKPVKRCKKGKVRRKGRCVKKHRAKGNSAKREGSR